MVDAFERLTFYPLAGSRFLKLLVFHYGDDKAKPLYTITLSEY